MEGISSTQKNQYEGDNQMSSQETKKNLVKKIADIHKHFETRIEFVRKEMNKIREKYTKEEQFDRGKMNFKQEAEFMTAKDLSAYQALEQEYDAAGQDVPEILRELLDLFYNDEGAVWQRMPCIGVPGSLAERNSRYFQTKLNNNYALEIGWTNYGEDDGQRPDTFRESYSVKIESYKEVVVKKGIFGVIGRKVEKKDFPSISLSVSQDEERKFGPSDWLKDEFDEPTRDKIQKQLIGLGKRLREQLG